MTKQSSQTVSDGTLGVRCINCGRLQQERHPDYPEYYDWFIGFPGKQQCADCYEGEIVTLQELNEQRRLAERSDQI